MAVTPTTLLSVGIALAAVLIVQGWILWRLLGAVGVVQRMDEKLAHFGDALTLLTETAEGGFRAVASELDRAGQHVGATAITGKKSPIPRPTSARMTAAAKRGRSVEEIASTEQVSEGEVRLRLHLAKQAAQAQAARTKRSRTEATSLAPTPAQEPKHGALRA
jgi:hypothetical protein